MDFENSADAEAAVEALTKSGMQAQMAKVGGPVIGYVCIGVTAYGHTIGLFLQQQQQDPTNLYVANLPLYVDDKYLEDMVKPFGAVISVRILREQGRGRISVYLPSHSPQLTALIDTGIV